MMHDYTIDVCSDLCVELQPLEFPEMHLRGGGDFSEELQIGELERCLKEHCACFEEQEMEGLADSFRGMNYFSDAFDERIEGVELLLIGQELRVEEEDAILIVEEERIVVEEDGQDLIFFD